MSIIDLSVTLSDSTETYFSEPYVRVSRYKTHKENGVNITHIESIGSHSGTHVDVPLHHIDDGMDTAIFPLDRFIGEAVAVTIPKGPGQLVTPEDLAEVDIRNGDILLVNMQWRRVCGRGNFFVKFPGFSVECAGYLIEKGVKCIGTDSPSVDKAGSYGAPFHHEVLKAGIGIVEALVNLEMLHGRRFLFSALPLKFGGGDGSPVRAVAVINN